MPQDPFFLYMPFSHVHTTASNQPEKQYAGCDFKNKTRRGAFGDALAEADFIASAVRFPSSCPVDCNLTQQCNTAKQSTIQSVRTSAQPNVLIDAINLAWRNRADLLQCSECLSQAGCQVIDKLEQHNLSKNTLVLFSSDKCVVQQWLI